MAGHLRRDFVSSVRPYGSIRPLVLGTRGAVASGHYLASVAGERMYQLGGTAIDAGIAAGIAINVLQFTHADFGGVAPIILFHADSGRAVTLDGLGVWPRATDVGRLRRASDGYPEGILRTVTPGAPDSWFTSLSEFGTLNLGEVLEPAWHLAANGAPVALSTARDLAEQREHVAAMYPTTLETFYPNGRTPLAGEVFKRPELAEVLKSLMDAEARARARGFDRKEAIQAARDVIYRGWVAEAIVAYHKREGGWMSLEDLADHRVEVDVPLKASYRGYEVFSCGTWCQGPLLLQTLNVLEYFDLATMGHNSVDYLHILIESLDRAFADRESFYTDPRLVQVPITGLLNKEYGRSRAATIDPHRASGAMPSPGDPWSYGVENRGHWPFDPVDVTVYMEVQGRLSVPSVAPAIDTSYVAAADAAGNVFSATPSDGSGHSPVIPGIGFLCSTRGINSRVQREHPAGIAPGKRPRLTPNPALLAVEGIPIMAFGCPGGDAQAQGMVQFVVSLLDFGFNIQQAIEAPRITSWNFPNSFAPHTYHPGRVDIESRITQDVRRTLRLMGHIGADTPDWAATASAVHAVAIDFTNGVLAAGADPRREGSALAW